MKRNVLLSALPLLFLPIACGAPASDDLGTTQDQLGEGTLTIPTLPSPSGNGALAPWGGSDSSKWRPEAVVANAVSSALNDAWKRPNVTDAIVALPTKMVSSNYYEFGDGQSNAAPSFPWWSQLRPQVVATLVRTTSAAPTITFRFDRALPYQGSTFEIQYAKNGQRPLTSVTLNATRTSEGDAIADWTPTPDLGWDGNFSGATILVHPTGWNDWFPIWFRMPVKKIGELKASGVRYSDGRSIVDREGVSSQGGKNANDGSSPFQRLMNHSFAYSYNNQGSGHVSPFVPNDVHAFFPYNNHNYVTGIGRGWTWVADERPSGFKDMYTCFERRRAADEATAPDGGVASGGGWHQINDTQETILNDLESAPLVVGSAMGNPWVESWLPSGKFSYNLTDVITVRFLKPGEAFITPAGAWVQDGKGGWYDQSNYHWYFFQQAQEVCTEELVTPRGGAPTGFDL
jgi:hypothetical protein